MWTMEMSSLGLVSARICLSVISKRTTVSELLNIITVNRELLYKPCSNLLGLLVLLFHNVFTVVMT